MKKAAHHLIAEVPGRDSRVEMTIGVDLGDVWSHYCTLTPTTFAVPVLCLCYSLDAGSEVWRMYE
jgi:hypothetical protein